MAAELNVKIGADVSGAVQGMSLVQQRVQALEGSIKYFQDKLANTQSQKFYAFALEQIAKKKQELAQITRATGGALDKSNDSTRRATQSMTDLSRVVQDAPYGFIGIANNINPLVESFGRLKKETGSTGGAFKALVGSLAGPAGIGIAISVVTSLLVAFGDKLFSSSKKSQEYTDALSKISTEQKILTGEVLTSAEAEKKQTEELQKQASALQKLNELIKRSSLSYAQRSSEAAASVSEEIALVNALASVVQNQSLSYEQRNNALQKLKAINQTYFGDLKLEENSLSSLTSKVKEYTSALISQEVVKRYTKDIADLTVANTNSSKSIDELKTKALELNNELQKTPKYVKTYVTTGGVTATVTELMDLNPEYKKLSDNIKSVNSEISSQVVALDKGQKAAAGLTDDLNSAVAEASKFKSPEIKPPKIDKVKIEKEDIKRNFQNLFSRLDLNIEIENPVIKALKSPEIISESEQIGRLINENIRKNLKPIQTDTIAPNVSDAIANQKKLLEEQLTVAQNVASGISSSFSQAFGSILEGQNVFTALGNALKGFVLELVQATIKALIFRAIVNAFVPGGVQAIGATGIANLLGFRANGGPVTGRSPYIVGERGPELFVPSVSGNILPNNQLGSFNGRPAFAGSMGGRSIVRGNDILLSYARTQRSQNRVNA